MSTELWKMVTGFETPDEANAELMRLRAELASEREARKAAEQREAENRDAYDRKNDELQDALARAEEAESELAVERSCKYDAELARDKATARAEQAEREREALREAFRGEAPDTYKAVASALVECLDDGPRMAMAKHARRMEARAREEKAARERAEAARIEAAYALECERENQIKLARECERAEADNAALVNEMSTALEHVSARRYGDAGEGLLAALNTAHPGAALLEEREKMRAHEAEMAESLRNALERLRALERAGVRQFVAPALSRVTVVVPVRPGRTEKDMSRKEELKVLSKNFGGCGCKHQCEREQGGEGEEWMGRKPNGRYAVCETEAEKLGVKIPNKTRAR